MDCYPSTTSFKSVSAHFDLPSALRINCWLLTSSCHLHQGRCLSCFPLPVVTDVHWHEIHHYYGFICHPLASLSLAFPLVPRLPAPSSRTWRASPGKSTCLRTSPSVLTCQVIQLSGFLIFRKVTHLSSQPRFTYVRSRTPPWASSRPIITDGALAYELFSRWLGDEGSSQPSGLADMPSAQKGGRIRPPHPLCLNRASARWCLCPHLQAAPVKRGIHNFLPGVSSVSSLSSHWFA